MNTAAAHRVTIWTDQRDFSGEFLRIEPACQEQLGQIETHRCRLVSTPEAGTRLRMEPHVLCPSETLHAQMRPDGPWEGDDFALTFVGLQRIVVRKLRDAGLDVPIFPRPVAELEGPAWSNLGAFDVVDRDVLEFVQQQDRGLIRYGGGVDRARLLVVPVATRRLANAITSRLAQWVPDVQRLITGGDPVDRRRLVVSLLGGLATSCVQIHHREIYLAADARQAISRDGLEGLKRAWRARVFALLPPEAQLSTSEWDQLRCWFGFAECEIPMEHG